MFGKIAAGVLVFFLLLMWLKVYIWIPVGIVLLIILIRFGADIYWWLNDNYKGGGWF